MIIKLNDHARGLRDKVHVDDIGLIQTKKAEAHIFARSKCFSIERDADFQTSVKQVYDLFLKNQTTAQQYQAIVGLTTALTEDTQKANGVVASFTIQGAEPHLTEDANSIGTIVNPVGYEQSHSKMAMQLTPL